MPADDYMIIAGYLNGHVGKRQTVTGAMGARVRHFTIVTDCKVVSYKTIAPQHRPLVGILRIKPPIKQREERTGLRRIKWWRFGEKKEETILLIRLPTITNAEESWNQMKDTIYKAASATLGVTKPDKLYINRDIWLWNDDISETTCSLHQC